MICVDLEKVCAGNLEVRFSLVKYQRLVNTILAAEGKKDGIQSLVLLWLDITSPEEAILLHMNGIGPSFRHSHNGVADLLFCFSKIEFATAVVRGPETISEGVVEARTFVHEAITSSTCLPLASARDAHRSPV